LAASSVPQESLHGWVRRPSIPPLLDGDPSLLSSAACRSFVVALALLALALAMLASTAAPTPNRPAWCHLLDTRATFSRSRPNKLERQPPARDVGVRFTSVIAGAVLCRLTSR
jgi:hypothetical protein